MFSKKMKIDMPIWLFVVVALAVFGFGAGVGGSSKKETTASSTTVETVQVPGKNVEVPTVPQSCLTAIERAKYNFGIASQAFSHAGDGFRAAGTGDLDGVEKAASDMNSDNSKLDIDGFNGAASECQSAAN